MILKNKAKGVLVVLVTLALCFVLRAQGQKQSFCPPLSTTKQSRLITYVEKKYGVPSTVKLSLKSHSPVDSSSCYRKLIFDGEGPLGEFSLTLYSSPNFRYLSADLMDSLTDPIREKEEKARKLSMEVLEGEYASRGTLPLRSHWSSSLIFSVRFVRKRLKS